MRLSDTIELFIKNLMEADTPSVELKRNELADYFGCAPSQINYVLATRFTIDDGYITESRRGGGGYIRIVRVVKTGAQNLQYMINERIGLSITENEAVHLIGQLVNQELISDSEGQIMAAAMSSQAYGVPVTEEVKNALRARSLKAMLTSVAQQNRDSCAGNINQEKRTGYFMPTTEECMLDEPDNTTEDSKVNRDGRKNNSVL